MSRLMIEGVEQEQSFDISRNQNLAFVHLFLNASIACILYTRRLIKWDSSCFLVRNTAQLRPNYFKEIDGIPQYFSSSACQPHKVATGQEFRILRKKGHRCADQVLDLLKHGVMDALTHNYLAALRLDIWGRIGTSNSVIESYTFVFRNPINGLPAVITSETNTTFLVQNLQKSFKKAIVSLLLATKDLPRLPKSGRGMGFSLLLNTACPLSYQPSGFAETVPRQATSWPDQDGSTSIAKLELHVRTVLVSIERFDRISEVDQAFSKQLNTLQYTSSWDPFVPLTLEETIPRNAGTELKSIYLQSCATGPAVEALQDLPLTKPSPSKKRAVEEVLEPHSPSKISKSSHLIAFSSSSDPLVDVDCKRADI